ncbi:four helix bundle protein [candidate division KSB1 bacterium]|nr:four helix bundle protein [candidate division KSB1 bacterium]
MLLKTKHKQLDVWKISAELVTLIYKLTTDFPKIEIYGLISQIRRAAISIPSNIAEGASRTTPAERKRFYSIARASLVEADTQLEIAKNLGYCTEDILKDVGEKINHTFAMLSNLISKTN